MSTNEMASTRFGKKRKLSEQTEGSGPSAKKARSGEENENGSGMGERDAARKNMPLHKPGEPNAKEKKKRRKKRRKVSIVQQNGAGPQAAAEGTSPVRARSEPMSNASASDSKNGTAGPSRVSPTPSVASDKAKTPAPAPTRESATPQRTMSAATDKGKGRATSPQASNLTAEADAQALTAHRSLLSAMLPSLTCQICLLLMSRPFSLAPCGHVSCHTCLVSWFSNEPGTLGQAIPPAEPPPNENGLEADGPVVNGNVVPAPPPPPPPPPPVIRRKKTCPHCRAVVRDKPAEVWSMKDMVSAVVRSGLADPESVPLDLREGAEPSSDASTADPWKDIFRHREADLAPFASLAMREHMGIRDEEDGGVYRCVDCTHEIWDGACSSCGRVYLGHRLDFDSDSQDDDLDHLWMQSDLDDEDDIDRINLFRHLVDAEHLGELGLGPHDLDDDEDDDEDDGDEDELGGGGEPHVHLPQIQWLGNIPVEEGSHHEESSSEHGEGIESGSDSEEGYESSFIDDDNDGDNDLIEIPGPPSFAQRPPSPPLAPPLRRSGRRHPPVIVVSSDEEDDGNEEKMEELSDDEDDDE
ncbi:hypothetical protein PHLGIDRAFT_11632 [Phlebiopsis gigantea 11061_1 CR5-6]|uniref:RING-type domain-containing protein n=1 Tax=Phlebiopsis gigantea (strain 11061_1 CR5-6) TaxID=745531 RepID=A0A0C3NWY6_PHLG1|nr:hypothetical protein PHLGIDRAFT_11632 [Phlebiopsis gigantea 11061_1 CR5-6]